MYGRYLYYLYELRRNLHLEASKLQKTQDKRVRAIVKHAYEHVPFYRRKFDKAGIKPEEIRSTSDLIRLPTTTKTEIQSAPLDDVIADNIDLEECVKGKTSGSTGFPLTVVIDRKAEDYRLALWTRAYFENGLRPWSKMAEIKDPIHFTANERLVVRLGILRRKNISIFDDPRHQQVQLESYRPDILKGYTSSIAMLANYCKNKICAIRPRYVFTGAELLLEADKNLIRSAFDCDVLDYYGCTEFSLLGWECQSHEGYHMNTDGTFIELVNGGDETVTPGERGEIVCTGLVNYAMPLIRYRTGDNGISTKEPCSCGRSLPLMQMMQGRADDCLTTSDGRIIPPTVFFPYPFKNLDGVKQFRVIQEKSDKLIFQLVAKEDFLNDPLVLENARKEVKRVFGKTTQVDFQFLDNIERDSTGKLRKVISCVSVNNK